MEWLKLVIRDVCYACVLDLVVLVKGGWDIGDECENEVMCGWGKRTHTPPMSNKSTFGWGGVVIFGTG